MHEADFFHVFNVHQKSLDPWSQLLEKQQMHKGDANVNKIGHNYRRGNLQPIFVTLLTNPTVNIKSK